MFFPGRQVLKGCFVIRDSRKLIFHIFAGSFRRAAPKPKRIYYKVAKEKYQIFSHMVSFCKARRLN